MKAKIMIILLATFNLSACNFMAGYGQENGANGFDAPQLQDARGSNVGKCSGSGPMNLDEGKAYLKYYGLPNDIQGNFACEGDKPVLPKSCDGRRLGMQELRAYWEKYQLPVGLTEFECSTGIPKVPKEQIAYKFLESQNPTCKDTNGKKRPCI